MRVLDDPDRALDDAVACLLDGLVVAIPTDTVYGLAARLEDGAVRRLFAAKHRPSTAPVAVLCASRTEAAGMSSAWSTDAATLAERYWPGPLTLVVAAEPALVGRLGGGGGVGLRVPDDALCTALLARSGPLAVTSANVHGEPPATCAADVLGLGGGVAAVLDGGTRDGAVSTVLDLTGVEPRVLREGAIPSSELLALLSGG